MLAVFFGSLFVLTGLGMPILFVLTICGIILMMGLGLFEPNIIAQRFLDGVNSYSLLAVPFFMLSGELMNRAGITKRLIAFAMRFIGHLKGGLGYVIVLTSVVFAGFSGSAIADTTAIGTALIPEAEKYGYKRHRVTGLVMASGIIGPIIPPSTAFIIYGVCTETSIIRLLMGGIIPGVFFGVGLMLVWYLISRNDTSIQIIERRKGENVIEETRKVTKEALWALILPLVIIGGMRFGYFTPTEGGIIAVFYSIIIGMYIYRELTLEDLKESFRITSKNVGATMLIIGAGSVTAWYITMAQIPGDIAFLLGGFLNNQTSFMFVVAGILFIVGMVMDTTPATLILAPIFSGLAKSIGIDPVYFGIIFVLVLEIGLLTPPVGIVLFTGARIGRVSVEDALRGLWPFLLIEIILVVLMILFPQIVMGPLNFFL